MIFKMKGEKLMNVKRLILTLVITALAAAQVPVVDAQSERTERRTGAGWAAIARSAHEAHAVRQLEPNQDMQSAGAEAIEPHDADSKKRIVGTWVLTVFPSDSPAFGSLQTYNADGTMTETSSLLPQLSVSPAHGVWEGKKNDYTVTFEMFAFDQTGETVGRLRVRGRVRVNNDDTLTGDGLLDLILPDGSVIPNIASTPVTGTRRKVVPAN
jgi:hypothetical protein